MKIYQIIQSIEQDLYDLPDLNDVQYEQITPLLSQLTEVLELMTTNIDNNKIPLISSLTQQRLIYFNQYEQGNFEQLFKKIQKELKKDSAASFKIPSSSLLASLYFLNDVIAGSTAMGRGMEESIIPDNGHIQVICKLLASISQQESDILHMINRCRYVKENKKYQKLVPLIFDIAETSYARLAGWRVSGLSTKQEQVDAFYFNHAESCMAKGTLWILRSLISLPTDFSTVLSELPLDMTVMGQLQTSSSESLRTIAEESERVRRYRGGNSGSAWLKARKTVMIEPGSAFSFSFFSRPDSGRTECGSEKTAESFSFL